MVITTAKRIEYKANLAGEFIRSGEKGIKFKSTKAEAVALLIAQGYEQLDNRSAVVLRKQHGSTVIQYVFN